MENKVHQDQFVAKLYARLFKATETGQQELASAIKKCIPEGYQRDAVFDNEGEPRINWQSESFDYLGYIGNMQLIEKWEKELWELKGKRQIMVHDIIMIAESCKDYGYALATDVIQDDIKDNPRYWEYGLKEFQEFIR